MVSTLPLKLSSEQDATSVDDGTVVGEPHNRSDLILQPRWYSLRTQQELRDERLANAPSSSPDRLWPPATLETEGSFYSQGITRIFSTFCFEGDDATETLWRAMAHAIARWWPAFRVSSAMIIPDLSCFAPSGADEKPTLYLRCKCGRQSNGLTTADGTLQIALGEKSRPLRSGTQTSPVARSDCTIGCNPWPSGGSPRNRMLIDGHGNIVDFEQRFQKHIEELTHELGHAMGLVHEHQRPDRDHFVHFDCTVLEGYPGAVHKARDPAYKQDWPEESTIEERMARICSEHNLAVKYLLDAIDFMIDDKRWKSHPNEYIYDLESFDYGSIMAYGSLVRAQPMTRPTMTRKFPTGYIPVMPTLRPDGSEFWYDSLFWKGGSRLWRLQSISSMDVSRIAQLYSGTAEQRKEMENFDPSTMMWERIFTKDMVDSHGWGHQIYEAIGPWIIEPVLPDVVGRD